MPKGHLIYLKANEPFRLAAAENSTLLLSILRPKHGEKVDLIGRSRAASARRESMSGF